MGADGEEGGRRRRRAHELNPEATLEATLEALNIKKFDLAFSVDPLFHKTSAQFDEGGAKGGPAGRWGLPPRGCQQSWVCRARGQRRCTMPPACDSGRCIARLAPFPCAWCGSGSCLCCMRRGAHRRVWRALPTTAGLLLNNLSVYRGCEIVFDSMDVPERALEGGEEGDPHATVGLAGRSD